MEVAFDGLIPEEFRERMTFSSHARMVLLSIGIRASSVAILQQLLRDDAHLAARAVYECGHRLADVRRLLDRSTINESLPTITLEQLVTSAVQEASDGDYKFVGTEHLLVAILEIDEPLAREIGIRVIDVRSFIDSLRWIPGADVAG